MYVFVGFRQTKTAYLCQFAEQRQQSADAFADGLQPKIVGRKPMWFAPEEFGSIVVGTKLLSGLYFYQKKGIGGVHIKVGETISVGQREEITFQDGFCPCLLHHLAQTTVLDAFARIHKAARQIERTFGRFQGTTCDEQSALLICDDGHSGSRSIVVKNEVA